MKKVILTLVMLVFIIASAACSATPSSPVYQENSTNTSHLHDDDTSGGGGNNQLPATNSDVTTGTPESGDRGDDVLQREDTTNESAGVPQRQIEYEMYPEGEEYFVDECVHDVDLDTHWDVVTVRYRREQEYLTTHYAISAVYQYEKASDTWTKIPNSNKKSFDYTLPESLVGETF